jgi:hypothetical protein
MKSCRHFPVFLALIAALFLTACDAGGSASSERVDPEQLIPASANFIAQVRVADILRDVDFESLYRQTPKSADDPQNLGELLDQAVGETGIDFREFNTAILFGDVSQREESVAAIVEGRFDQARLIQAIEEYGETPLTLQDYQGQEIHVGESDDQTLGLSFLSDDVLVVGTLGAVQAVIDVQQGNMARASGKVFDSYQGLGQPLFKMAMDVPPEALAELDNAGGGFMPFSVEALRDLDVVTMVVDRPGDDLKIEAQLNFTNGESAEEIGNTLVGFLALAKGFISDEEARKLLERLEIFTVEKKVTLIFQAPMSELQQVAGGLDGSADKGSGY